MKNSLPRWAWVLLAGAVVLASAFLLGRYVQRSADEAEAVQHALDQNADSLRHAAATLDTARRAVAAAARVDTVVRTRYVTVRAQLHVASESALAVGNGPPIVVPPLVVSTIRSADATIAADSLLIRTLAADTVALAHDRDLWQSRATIAETALKRRQGPRLGLKTGAVLGAAIATVVLRPQLVAAVWHLVARLAP